MSLTRSDLKKSDHVRLPSHINHPQDDRRHDTTEVTTIHQLPPEVLIDIFRQVVGVGHDNKAYYSNLRKLRLVSIRWRDIIHQNASFWTSACCLDTKKDLEMALEKGKGLPMTIYFPCSLRDATTPHDHTQFVQTLGAGDSDVVPWRTLNVIANPQTLPCTETVLKRAAPHLEEAQIMACGTIAGELFAGQAPRLRSLLLYCCSVEWTSSVLLQLRSLSVVLLRPPTPAATFVQIIAATTQLEALTIQTDCTFDRTNALFSKKNAPIALPLLRTLDLRVMSCGFLIWFLEHISAPEISSFKVEESIQQHADKKLIPALEKWIRRHTQKHPSTTMAVGIHRPLLHIKYGSEYPLSVTLGIPIPTKRIAAMASKILGFFGPAILDNVASLSLELDGYSEDSYDAIHHHFDSITSLAIDLTHPSILSVFTPLASPRTTWLFPRMTKFQASSRWHFESAEPAAKVLNLIESRNKEGGGCPERLRIVRLDHGTIKQEELDAIKETGVTVEISRHMKIV